MKNLYICLIDGKTALIKVDEISEKDGTAYAYKDGQTVGYFPLESVAYYYVTEASRE